VVGYHTACAEIKGLRFSGLFAWLLWRAIYLSKLPGFERKARVLVDWLLELFFPRDTVQTRMALLCGIAISQRLLLVVVISLLLVFDPT
jgi:hypothetical protein